MPGERIGYVCIPDSVTDSACSPPSPVHPAPSASLRAVHDAGLSLAPRHCVPDLEAYDQTATRSTNALSEMGYEV